MKKSQRETLSAEKRIILVFALSTIASIVLVGVGLSYFLGRTAIAQTRTNLEARAGLLARQCESEITEARLDLEFLAKTYAFRQLPFANRIDFSINGIPGNIDIEKRRFLTGLMNKVERFSVTYVLRPNGDIYLVEPFKVQPKLTAHNLSERPYFREAVRTKSTVISDCYRGADGVLAVAILIPILGGSNDVTGYLGGVFHLRRLSQLVSREKIKPFDAGFIVDRQGHLIAHTDTMLLRDGIREHFTEHHQLLARFIASAEGTAGARQPAVLLGECMDSTHTNSHLTALVPLSSGWELGLSRDKTAIVAEVRPVVWGITALAGLLLAIIGGFGIVIAHGIGRRWDSAERALRESEEALRVANETLEQRVLDRTSELAKSKQLLDETGRLARVGGWDIDLEKNTLSWSDMVYQIHEIGREYQPTVEGGINFYAPEAIPVISEAVQRAMVDGQSFDVELELITARKNRLWVRANGQAYRENGKIVKIGGVFQDIHARKLAEIELRKHRDHLEELVNDRTAELATANANLEKSNKELEQFAYVASHDLQEPLRMVSSYTQLLAQKYEAQLDDKAKKYINYAVDGAIRMQRLINDLLTYSRISTQGKPSEPVDSHSVLGEALRNLAATIEENRAVIINDDLPMVRADGSQLMLVFQNLIANAIKFRREEIPQVHISINEQEREWVFSVKDNGIGIDPRYSERLFVIFQRLHTKEEYPGTGIGLAVCKRIVERHGGRIWFESELGKGTVFFFTIPKQERTEV
jgi:signal transduction histidine kinase